MLHNLCLHRPLLPQFWDEHIEGLDREWRRIVPVLLFAFKAPWTFRGLFLKIKWKFMLLKLCSSVFLHVLSGKDSDFVFLVQV